MDTQTETQREMDSLIRLLGAKIVGIQPGDEGESPTLVFSTESELFPEHFHLYKVHRFDRTGNVSSVFHVEEVAEV